VKHVSPYDDKPALAEGLNRLRKKLGVGMAGGDKVYIRITLASMFEPHGRASESWDPVWNLTLVNMKSHWRTTENDWVECTSETNMTFKGQRLGQCVAKALQFLEEPHITKEEHDARVKGRS
jgi:hypothetical protein